ncbi:MAG: hypothetical protein KVP17_003104 [Porospora cf. gigantea B]|nr:MAG: hypothetical protein KVP17_003104 [Porospora cf. gigantea B]
MRILADGRPIFGRAGHFVPLLEAAVSHPDAPLTKMTDSVSQITSLARRQELKDDTEKLFMHLSQLEKEKLRQTDPVTANSPLWDRSSAEHHEALEALRGLEKVMNLLRFPASVEDLGYPPDVEAKQRKRMAAFPSIDHPSVKQDAVDLMLATVVRLKHHKKLLQQCDKAHAELKLAVPSHLAFLKLITELLSTWNLHLQPVAPHVFTEVDWDHPHRAEVWVEVFSPPSSTWIPRMRRAENGKVLNAPNNCWPSIPGTDPFSPVWGQIFCKQADEGLGLDVLLQFSGDTADMVKKAKRLQVSLRLTNVSGDSSECAVCSARRRLRLPPPTVVVRGDATEPRTPPSDWPETTMAVHRSLKNARAICMDRAIFSLSQQQGCRLEPDALDAWPDGSRLLTGTLYCSPPSRTIHPYGKEDVVTVLLPMTLSSASGPAVLELPNFPVHFRMVPQLLDWNSSNSTFTMKDFPCFLGVDEVNPTVVQSRYQCNEDWQVPQVSYFTTDVIIDISFKQEASSVPSVPNGLCPTCTAALQSRCERLNRICEFSLRNHFLLCWKQDTLVAPALHFDFHIMQYSGERFLKQWMRWLMSHLATIALFN